MSKPKLSEGLQMLQDRQERKRAIREASFSMPCGDQVIDPKMLKNVQVLVEETRNVAKQR